MLPGVPLASQSERGDSSSSSSSEMARKDTSREGCLQTLGRSTEALVVDELFRSEARFVLILHKDFPLLKDVTEDGFWEVSATAFPGVQVLEQCLTDISSEDAFSAADPGVLPSSVIQLLLCLS